MSDARSAWQVLRVSSGGEPALAARRTYNEAIEELLDKLRCGRGDWDTRAAALGTEIDRSASLVDPDSLDALVDLGSIDIQSLKETRSEDGLGVVMVGWRETTPVGTPRADFLPPNGDAMHLVAVLDFERETPQWRFHRRFDRDSARVGKVSHHLAANWSAPNEFYWRMCQLDDLLLQNVFLPERFTEETGLYFLEPYDPDKIPIVFVHGLVSSPDAFKNVLNTLDPEEWFRDKYQVWLYNYPTGNPWAISAVDFRKNVRKAVAHAKQRGGGALLDEMVVVCHSMGGLLTRCSVTEPGNAFYGELFNRPFDQLDITDKQRQFLKDTLLYQPLTEPKRVVFMATPHRGSPMATWGPSAWISRLIKLPKTLTVDLLDQSLLAVSNLTKNTDDKVKLSSINSLSPKARAIVALDKLPLPGHIKFHSIIGDRGRGDTPDSSDGVVPYWSSHVEPVESETIVDSNHGVPDCPEASEELIRILKLHLTEK